MKRRIALSLNYGPLYKTSMQFRSIAMTCALLVAGGISGWVAQGLHLPLPWMLGSLISSALVAVFGSKPVLKTYKFPMNLRTGFVALIGVMIGTQVTPEVVAQLRALPVTILGLLIFIVLSQCGNYMIFRRLGGFDRPTSFYAGAPGGLIESLVLGEAAGADPRRLTIQHFLRVILTIILVPAGISLWLGTPVGSAGGAIGTLTASAPVPLTSLGLICLTAGAGLLLARMIHLPAAQLMGPFFLSGALTLSAVVDLHLPFWLIALSQVVIGVSLGMRFQGTDMAMLRQSGALALTTVLYMLSLGGAISAALSWYTGLPFLYLLISFAPGGVIEMSVIALSIAANPAFVSVHHVLRILITVLGISFIGKSLKMRADQT